MIEKAGLELHQLFSIQNSLDKSWTPSGPIAWSVTNIVVLVSVSTTSRRQSHHLHFFHPDTPWELTALQTPHNSDVTHLKFDGTGMLLVVIDSHSQASLWKMNGHIINDWQLTKVVDASETLVIDNLPVLSACWSNTVPAYERPSWVITTDDLNNNWTSKYTKIKKSYLAQSKDFERCIIAVTASGKVSVIDPGETVVSTNLPVTNMVTADIVIPTNEKSSVRVASVDNMNTIRLHKIEIPHLKISLLRVLEIDNGPGNIINFTFNSPHNCDVFFITLEDAGEGGLVERWELSKEQVYLNPMLTTDPRNTVGTLEWLKKESVRLPSCPASVHVPAMSFNSHISYTNRIGQCIAVTCEDGSLYILHRTKLGVCDSRPSIQGTEAKRHVIFSPVSCCLLSLAQSILTCNTFWGVGLELDTEAAWLCSAIEHCLLNNWDYWEVMAVAIRKDELVQRLECTLNGSFNFQNPDIRQLYFSRMMSAKMTLYKLQAPTSHWPLHIWGTMFLNTLADKFKAMLSLECLNNLVYSQDKDLNSILTSLDLKQFSVPEATLLIQQPLFQWILDYSQLISICVLPQKRTSMTINWQSVLTDSKTLNNLRDVLLLVKIWSTLSPRCSPVLPNCEASDFGSIFKSVSMLLKQFPSKNDVPTAEHDQIQLFQQSVTVTPTVHNSCLLLGNNNESQEFTFHCEPSSVKCSRILAERPVLAMTKTNSVMNPTDRDMLRNTVLSAHSLHLKQDYIKQCVVCGCVTTLLQPPTQQQWWNKWRHACVCGGMWKRLTVMT